MLNRMARAFVSSRAMVLNQFGKPLSMQTLNLADPHEDEVLLKTQAVGCCKTDLSVIDGKVNFVTPAVMGHEVTAEVIAKGSKVRNVDVGDRVVGAFIMPCGTCDSCNKGMDDVCTTFLEMNRKLGVLYDGKTRMYAQDGTPVWQYSMGGLSEYCVTTGSDVSRLPDNLPYEESAILGCAVFTAYGAVKNSAELRGGQSVAIVGTGGVGGAVLQFAKSFGAAPIIAVDISNEKLEQAKALGADIGINPLETNAVDKIIELTNGGVDVSFEVLGNVQTFQTAVHCVRAAGKAVIIGLPPSGTEAVFNYDRLVRKRISIQGSYGARTRTDLPEVIKLAEAGLFDVNKMIAKKWHGLESANDAFDALRAGKFDGKSVIKIAH